MRPLANDIERELASQLIQISRTTAELAALTEPLDPTLTQKNMAAAKRESWPSPVRSRFKMHRKFFNRPNFSWQRGQCPKKLL